MGDPIPYLSSIVAAVLAYIAMRTATERRFGELEAKLSAQEERILQVREDTRSVREVLAQIAQLSAKLDDIAEDVRQHNHIMEKTIALEHELRATRAEVSALRDGMKVGGTS